MRKPERVYKTALLAVMFGLAGCSAPVTHSADTDHLITVPARWDLVEIMGKPVDATSGRVPWISFEPKEKRVHGVSGCNRFNGTYKIGPGNHISFSRVAAMQMACQNMSMEAEFHRAISVADNFIVNDEDLVLGRARMAPLIRFKATTFKSSI